MKQAKPNEANRLKPAPVRATMWQNEQQSGPGFTIFTLCGTLVAQLKGKATMMFITHAMPKNLLVDEIVRIGSRTLSAVSDAQDKPKQEIGEGAHGT